MDKKYILLFCYHIVFIVIAFQFRVNRGISDAHYYWAKTFDIQKHSWLSFAHYGTDVILFLNYPFIKLGFPFWFGFLMYGVIGFFGIKKFIDWTFLVFGEPLDFKGINILYLVFLLPNLHFWTASLGKEPLIFWGIASVLYGITLRKFWSFSFIIGALLILLIRPHIAFILLLTLVTALIFNNKIAIKKKIRLLAFSFFPLLVLTYMILQLSNIRYWDWSRITYFNEYSILSFRNSRTYVPMLDYNYFYKLFSFNFRPIFYDAKSIWTIFASIENSIVFLICIMTLYFIIKFYKSLEFPQWTKVVFLLTIIASLIYVERYANLGIFMRTKIMFQPFTLIALLYICKQGFILNNTKA